MVSLVGINVSLRRRCRSLCLTGGCLGGVSVRLRRRCRITRRLRCNLRVRRRCTCARIVVVLRSLVSVQVRLCRRRRCTGGGVRVVRVGLVALNLRYSTIGGSLCRRCRVPCGLVGASVGVVLLMLVNLTLGSGCGSLRGVGGNLSGCSVGYASSGVRLGSIGGSLGRSQRPP